MSCKIIEVIECDDYLDGTGESEEDPVRRIYRLYTKEGKIIFEYDPYTKKLKGGQD